MGHDDVTPLAQRVHDDYGYEEAEDDDDFDDGDGYLRLPAKCGCSDADKTSVHSTYVLVRSKCGIFVAYNTLLRLVRTESVIQPH